ncbi:MAG: Peptidase S16 lon domain protein [Thermoanaerobacterales bacterium 50_218]|nr:MAG: Peptidase S16 lon domain protein [Thermoanaerobacterales bacterium 50_218]HAA89221.1 ATP-dependent protease [Peptococcaceae bacterium]
MVRKAAPEEVRAVCRPEEISSAATDAIKPLEAIIGQERAVRALEFGLGISAQGFNIFVAGLPGTGKNTAVQSFLETIAVTKPVPPDWCYVYNFREPYCPRALKLPPGHGKQFAEDMRNFLKQARQEIPRLFKSDEYAQKKDETIERFAKEKNSLLSALNEKAEQEGFVIQIGPTGIFIIPTVEGKPLSAEEFDKLPEETKKEIMERRKQLEDLVTTTLREVQKVERKAQEAVRELDRQVVAIALDRLLAELKEKYSSLKEVLAYFDAVYQDILDNISLFRKETIEEQQRGASLQQENPFRKYEVNVIVDNSETKGAPVVVELNPTYTNLFGTIEKEAHFGALITDFTLIRAGSLHRANGGYLVVSVEELLRNPFSWDGLKRALRDRLAVIEDPLDRLGVLTTKGLRPEPIPLDLKVILLGDALLYTLLYYYDPDFRELFKVKAEFGVWMDRTKENIQKYAAFFATLCQKENLIHFDASAVAKLVEHGSRLAGFQDKLSTRFAEIADLAREASYYAQQEGAPYVTADHVNKAAQEKVYRSNLVQQVIQEMIKKNIILLDIEGEKVGQVNGLSVISLGDLEFGKPTRITATVAAGRGGIIDIEREAKLGGKIHTKGVLILGGYLSEKYRRESPLALSARLVFEQSYEGVEGDSASSAELFALLSALAGVPLKQNLAVTGSVNQKGEIQPVGGINEKIEGFFDVCRIKGLTGDQGVLIPEGNLQQLMLREDVVEAVREGKFHIYLIRTVDEGLELLTGMKPGERQPDGTFPEGTFHYLVAERLKELSQQVSAAARDKKDSDSG